MFRVANSYFDALEGDNGRIGAFADDCVRHENGYRTVNTRRPWTHDAWSPTAGSITSKRRRS
jgi:hypothetical protein